MKIKFECKNCKCNLLEEVVTDVDMYSTISDMEKTDNGVAVCYRNSNTEFGDVLHYQCANCDEIIEDGAITSPEELYEWLESNGMLEERN